MVNKVRTPSQINKKHHGGVFKIYIPRQALDDFSSGKNPFGVDTEN